MERDKINRELAIKKGWTLTPPSRSPYKKWSCRTNVESHLMILPDLLRDPTEIIKIIKELLSRDGEITIRAFADEGISVNDRPSFDTVEEALAEAYLMKKRIRKRR